MYPVSDMAQGLLQVLGVQHDTLNEELQRVRQVTLLRSPRAKGQGYSDRRYPGEQVRRSLWGILGFHPREIVNLGLFFFGVGTVS